MGSQLLRREIEEGGFQITQRRGELPGGAEGHGEDGGLFAVFVPDPGVEGPHIGGGGGGAPLAGELLQHLTAQGVEGGHRYGEVGLHQSPDLGAAVGRAAGAGELLFHRLGGEGLGAGRLGDRPGGSDHPAVHVLDPHLDRLAGADHGVEDHVHPLELAALILAPGLGEELTGLRGLLPDAEHGGAFFVLIVAVGEALAGEGGLQVLELLVGGFPVLLDGSGVHPGDHRDVFRPLHAPLDLQALDPQLLEVLDVAGQGHVLEGERVAVGLLAPAVFEAAGLGAQATVARPAADDGGEVALAGVAHAQGAVDEGLDLDGRVETDVLDGVPGKLPGEDHPGHAQLGAAAHAVQGVDGELGGAVDGQAGGGLPEHPQNAQVLDEDGVHAHLGGLGGHLGGGGELPVSDQGVEGQVDLGAPDVAVRNRRGQLLQGEVLGVAAGVEVPVAQVDGVGTGLDGGGDGFRRPGGGEQFQHGRSPPREK